MIYTPTEWHNGDVITAEKLNNIENGIATNDANISQLQNSSLSDRIAKGEGEGAVIEGRISGNYHCIASGMYSHAEGNSTTSSGVASHAEGDGTTASGNQSHAEGAATTAIGNCSHAEGRYTIATGKSEHVFGEYNTATNSDPTQKSTYVEIVGNGTSNDARSNARTLDWSGNEVLAGKLTVGAAPTADMDVATKKYVDDKGDFSDRIAKGTGTQSIKIGNVNNLTASGTYSYAEGTKSKAIANYSHAQGFNTITNGNVSHAEGGYSETSEDTFYGHAEGYRTSSQADAAHAEGVFSIAAGKGSHAEGGQIAANPRALQSYSFSLYLTGAANTKTYTYTGDMPFYVGHFVILTTTNQLFKITAINTTNKTITFDNTLSSTAINNQQMYFSLASQAVGVQAHAEGASAAAFGDYSHAQGMGTIAKNKSQYVFGEYNEVDSSNNASTKKGNYIEIVGKGASATSRSNARTLDWDGNESLAGGITLGKGTANEVTLTPETLKQLIALLPST